MTFPCLLSCAGVLLGQATSVSDESGGLGVHPLLVIALILLMLTQTLAIKLSVYLVNKKSVTMSDAFVTWVMLAAVLAGANFMVWVFYDEPLNKHAQVLNKFGIGASPAELVQAVQMYFACIDPIGRWAIPLAILLAGAAIFAWRHTGNWLEGMAAQITSILLFGILTVGSVALLVTAAQMHTLHT